MAVVTARRRLPQPHQTVKISSPASSEAGCLPGRWLPGMPFGPLPTPFGPKPHLNLTTSVFVASLLFVVVTASTTLFFYSTSGYERKYQTMKLEKLGRQKFNGNFRV